MNLAKDYPRKDYAINQFCQPHVTELKGKNFRFVLDNGKVFLLNVLCDEKVQWGYEGCEMKEATYECLKGDDTTYLLDYDVEETKGTPNYENHLFIIDMEQRLVTMLRAYIGYNPRFPWLVKSEFEFGAIDMPGYELPFKRHCYTAEMFATRVEWHWNTHMYTRHQYFTPNFYRLTWPQESSAVEKIGGPFEKLPSSDEIAFYIKIKDGLYLFSLTEEMMERVIDGSMPNFRSNCMTFIQNYDRMYHVGRTFGNIDKPDGSATVPCRTLFGAFGNPIKLPDDFINADNAYTV